MGRDFIKSVHYCTDTHVYRLTIYRKVTITNVIIGSTSDKSERNTFQRNPHGLPPVRIQWRKLSSPDINLKRRMKEPRGTQDGVSSLTKLDELLFGSPKFPVFVRLLLFTDSRHANFLCAISGRVVVAYEKSVVLW